MIHTGLDVPGVVATDYFATIAVLPQLANSAKLVTVKCGAKVQFRGRDGIIVGKQVVDVSTLPSSSGSSGFNASGELWPA